MLRYTHKVAGLYITSDTATLAYENILKAGFKPEQVRLIEPHDPHASAKIEPEGKEVGRFTIHGIEAGIAVGIVSGILLVIALQSIADALFASAPFWGPALIVIYSTMLGAVAGGIAGLRPREYLLAGRILDRIKGRHYAVLVHTKDKQELSRAHDLIRSTAPESEYAY